MKKSGHTNILLLELLVVIFFFMISVTTIVELFATARLKSTHAQAANAAMLQAENAAERLYARDDAEGELTAMGFVQKDGAWVLEDERYTLQAEITEEQTDAGRIRTVTLTAVKNGEQLLQIPAARYIPGEVKP